MKGLLVTARTKLALSLRKWCQKCNYGGLFARRKEDTVVTNRRRDDFSMRVRRTVSARVGLLCSNPECRAVTAGPKSDPEKAITIGVAAHISAAAPGGPRYNERLGRQERCGVGNAIWLCQNCARLIDTDPERFTEAVLLKWKRDAELEAKHQLGKKRNLVKRSMSASWVHKKLALKRKIERDFAKARGVEVIIHCDEDELYPEFWGRPGISNWFKADFWRMYHNGIELGLSLEYAIKAADGKWAIVPSQLEDGVKDKVKVFLLGRIPFSNIVDYDLQGDEYYPGPHIYSRYVDGSPYEGFAAELVDSPYKSRFAPELKAKFEEIAPGECA
jgi:hypothetical protein